MPGLDTSFDDKLYDWGLNRVQVPFLPDPGLYGVATAHEGPEELLGVPGCGADYVAIHEPVHPYRLHVFG